MKNQFQPAKHQTHWESLWRFLALIVILLGYFAYVSIKYDAATGAWLAALTWSFFVLCTPVADGGFIVAFPIRLLFGTRMLVTQIIVWIIAVLLNVVALQIAPEAYEGSPLTAIFKTILTTPWPYWSILILLAAGTLLSIWFGDEMIDVTSHSERKKHHAHGFKHRGLVIFVFGLLTVLAYYQLIDDLGVNLSDL